MARPRVFVSSTFYDLKHIRASLDNFVSGLGYEPILSEKGDIAYAHDRPLDESCYREVENCDLFVLIIGGRYGHEISETRGNEERSFFEQYVSVTKQEFQTAIRLKKPSFILIESSVYSEYQTYKQNVGNERIRYAHVDSVNIFKTIDEIKSLNSNNPIKTFEKFSELEEWLKNQWAGLFREQLRRNSNAQELANLSSQVDSLNEINTTLKNYLESLIQKVNPEEANKLILSESVRLKARYEEEVLRHNGFYIGALASEGISIIAFGEALRNADTFEKFVGILEQYSGQKLERVRDLGFRRGPIDDLNEARKGLGLVPYNYNDIESKTESILKRRK